MKMWKKAGVYVWIFYSALAFTVLLLTALLPDDLVYKTTPQCYSVKQFRKECFMCGSTRGFVAMGNGNILKAWASNRLSVLLYITIILNSIVAITYLSTKNKNNYETG